MTNPDATACLGHDLNNLLTAIIGAADAILERSSVDPETRADAAHMREGARRGAILVRQLTGEANEGPAAKQLISVNDTISATSRLLAHRLAGNVALAFDLAEPDSHVIADPAQIDRVLLNLVANAGLAMPDGGTVIVSTTRRSLSVDTALVPDTIPAGEYVVIAVADTGTGISSGRLPHIFEAGFSSRKCAGGSGLGLSSVLDIVHRLHGRLSVSSAQDCGARFEMWLPRGQVPLSDRTASLPGSGAVLLVEDDPLVRQVIEHTLHRAGWTVSCVAAAEHALATLSTTGFDLLISDVAMADMDGVALVRLVLQRHPGLPVILTSGYAQPNAMQEFAEANVGFLLKPFGRADLLDAVVRSRVAGVNST